MTFAVSKIKNIYARRAVIAASYPVLIVLIFTLELMQAALRSAQAVRHLTQTAVSVWRLKSPENAQD